MTDDLAARLAYYKARGERELAAAHDVVTRHSGENILALVGAVEAVLELHAPLDRGAGPQCAGCATHVTFTRWPCKTVEAIRTALEGSTDDQ